VGKAERMHEDDMRLILPFSCMRGSDLGSSDTKFPSRGKMANEIKMRFEFRYAFAAAASDTKTRVVPG
jgi:hypothetical protein